MIRRALAIVLLACACSVNAAPPQPDAAMAKACRERFTWLLTIPSLTAEERVANMRAFFGQEFEVDHDKGRENQPDVYLVRRDPATGYVTFREIVGSARPAE